MHGRDGTRSRSGEHRFGGDWTDAKLVVLKKYLAAYGTVLRNKPNAATPFRREHIDAFAGTGFRTQGSKEAPTERDLLFAELLESRPQALLDGSASIALAVQPPFDRYYFIESAPARCESLRALALSHPSVLTRVEVIQGEANAEVRRLCARDWRGTRAVLFLDPYGMQVEWETIEHIAKTGAIDLWLLMPLMALNRLLTRSGEIPGSWREAVDRMLGTTTWFDEFYVRDSQAGLFDDEDLAMRKVKLDVLGRKFVERLATRFPEVARPGVLRNSTNSPLYLLCFAAANPKGAPIAVRIANALLRDLT